MITQYIFSFQICFDSTVEYRTNCKHSDNLQSGSDVHFIVRLLSSTLLFASAKIQILLFFLVWALLVFLSYSLSTALLHRSF